MDFRLTLGRCGVWEQVREKVLAAQTKEEVAEAFRSVGRYGAKFIVTATVRKPDQFIPRTPQEIVLQAIKHRDFPKRDSEDQIAFIADSLGAAGDVTARRSREICKAERAKKGGDRREFLPSWLEGQQRQQVLKLKHYLELKRRSFRE